MSITWSDASTASTGNTLQIRKAVWADTLGLFVAVGDHTGNIGGTGSLARVQTSPDGQTWTLRNAANAYQFKGLAWNGTTLVAVTNSTLTTLGVTITDQVMTSTDGITWTARTSAETNPWESVVWAAGLSLFVAVASAGTHRVMTSPDGVTWTGRTASSAKSWLAVGWSPSLALLVALASDSGTSSIMTSTDGSTWTGRSTGAVTSTFIRNSLTWSPDLGMFVAGSGGSHLFTSTDGTAWADWSGAPSGWTSTFTGQGMWSHEGSIFVIASGQSDSNVLTSADGVTWTSHVATASGNILDAVAYSPTLAEFSVFAGSHLDFSAFGITDSSVASIAPSSGTAGGGTLVTIHGTGVNGGFQAGGGTVRVRFGTYPTTIGGYPPDPSVVGAIIPTDFGVDLADWHVATSVTIISSGKLTCLSSIGQDTKDVLVYLDGLAGPNVLAWFPAGYTFINPVIISLTPSTGPSWGGTPVTVTGTNLFVSSITGGSGDLFFGHYGTGVGAYAYNVTLVSSTSLTCIAPAGFVNTAQDVTYVPPHLSTALSIYTYPTSTLSGAYTYVESWWRFAVPDELNFLFLPPFSVFSFALPSLPDWVRVYFGYTEQEWLELLIKFPPFRWWTLSTAPDHNGWWGSTADFGGDSFLLTSTDRPVAPRSWSEVATFATGSTAMLGGSPGAGCVFNNRLLYPASTYQNSYPTIRLYNGRSDYQLCTIPPTASGAVPYTVMSMLAANGSIYLSTLDTGTDSTTWVGRVFSLDITSGVLAPIGGVFTTGHVPYALAWHNGKLWCGTHRQSTASPGKVFWIRPDIDTAWTDDHTLASGSVSSLLGFQGQLYVGTTNAAGTFALLLKRSTAGAYTTADTGSGGTAKDSNGFIALTEFSGTLYASYWNDDTSPISVVRKSSDGTTFSTSYTGSSGTNRPFIGFTIDNGFLLAIGGGLSRTGAVVRTPDGITWTDETAFLETSDETALPIFGTVVA